MSTRVGGFGCITAIVVALLVWLSMPSAAQPYASAFPSDGALLVSENDLVAVLTGTHYTTFDRRT